MLIEGVLGKILIVHIFVHFINTRDIVHRTCHFLGDLSYLPDLEERCFTHRLAHLASTPPLHSFTFTPAPGARFT